MVKVIYHGGDKSVKIHYNGTWYFESGVSVDIPKEIADFVLTNKLFREYKPKRRK